mgnify:CR=1 FL=1
MTRMILRLSKALAAVTLITLLSACGGSGGSTPAASGNPTGGSNPPDNVPQTPTIEGIATPSSVSVVTATNAD